MTYSTKRGLRTFTYFHDMIRRMKAYYLILFVLGFAQLSYGQKYKTENVIVLIMDGPRYTETWGDSTHQHIPHFANDMVKQGVLYSNFRNNGPTYTAAGHTAICTGVYQGINNGGLEFPKNPSMFQYWLKKTGKARTAAWVISSKDKLVILSECRKKKWRGQFRPYTDCGINGLYTGYRPDQVTYENTLEILEKHKPNLVMVNFRQPDSWGHVGNWEKYLSSMKMTDQYIYGVFKYIQNSDHYRGKTTVIVTNDHGRHLDGRKDAFVSHGDGCEGCRHIIMWAYGPDFVKDTIFTHEREQIDIPVTIGELLGFEIPTSKGQVMTELFAK